MISSRHTGAPKRKKDFHSRDDDSFATEQYNRRTLGRASGVMIHSLKLNGYRGLSKFAMGGLARITLMVGKNNCGKTTLLEALSLLRAGNDLSTLWTTLARRGEQ